VPVSQSHPPNPRQSADLLQGSKNDLCAMFNIHASEYLTIPQQTAALVHHGKRPLWGKVCVLVHVCGKARAILRVCVRESVRARPAWRVDLEKIHLDGMCACQTHVQKNAKQTRRCTRLRE
jgi:hypothetical protein